MSTSFTIPATQKAWVSVKKGPPGKSLELRKDWPVQKDLKPGEVLVKIHAAALNPVGYKLMEMLPGFIAKRPYVPEHDFSGTVVVANDNEEFKVGDEVYGWIPSNEVFASRNGTLQEYLKVSSKNIVLRPSTLSEVGAAGVTLTALTAFDALNDAKLEEGQTLFVNGGSTAVGAFAIQLGKARGAKVVATASQKNEEYVRGLGADEFIDYTSVGPLHTYLTNNPPSARYNVILDAVGLFDPSLYTYSSKYLAPNGYFVSTGPQPHGLSLGIIQQGLKWAGLLTLPSFLTRIKPKLKIVLVKNKKESLEKLRELFAEGKLKASVDSVWAFEDVLGAYDKIKSRRARGKVTINVSLPASVETAKSTT